MEGKLASPKPVRYSAVSQNGNTRRRLFSEQVACTDNDIANAEVQEILDSRESLRNGSKTERSPSQSYRILSKLMKPPNRSKCTKWQRPQSASTEGSANSL